MSVNRMSTVTGEYYSRVGSLNGYRHVPAKRLLDRALGPNAWYKAEFEDPKSGISSTIMEWRHGMAVDSYLSSLTIRQSGLVVYSADVSYYNVQDHINQRYNRDPDWLTEVIQLTSLYSDARLARA